MESRTAKVVSWILVVALGVTEIVATGLMWLGKSPVGVVIHALLGVIIVVVSWWALHAAKRNRIYSRHQPTVSHVYTLIVTNLAMLEVIAIHDCDHMRQAMGWNYQFTLALLLVNMIVYLPNLLSLILASQGQLKGVIATLVSGPLIAAAFLKLHLLGAWLPVWGPWNRSFFALGVDMISWWILAITAIAGILVGMMATYILGQLTAS